MSVFLDEDEQIYFKLKYPDYFMEGSSSTIDGDGEFISYGWAKFENSKFSANRRMAQNMNPWQTVNLFGYDLNFVYRITYKEPSKYYLSIAGGIHECNYIHYAFIEEWPVLNILELFKHWDHIPESFMKNLTNFRIGG